jgi:glycosyltransferase involved in cell wall biosynthesis
LRIINIDLERLAIRYRANQLLRNNYDIAIAASEGVPTLFVSYLTKVKKIAWIRCDYSNYLMINNDPKEREIYRNIESIICVSKYTQKSFSQVFPEFSSNSYGIPNLINVNEILSNSKIGVDDQRFNNKYFTILSIGRIDKVKRFSNIPDIVDKLVKRNLVFRWFLIGPKGDFYEWEIIESKIDNYRIKDKLIYLGPKENPYPYIKLAHLVVCTSYSEAAPNVINEAKILDTPVISTNFGSSYEFINNDVDGLISPIEDISDKIHLLASDQHTYNRIKQNVIKFEYNNSNILKEFHQVLDK